MRLTSEVVWHRLRDKHPQEEESVLILTDDDMFAGHLITGGRWGTGAGDSIPSDGAHLWARLPSPPRKPTPQAYADTFIDLSTLHITQRDAYLLTLLYSAYPKGPLAVWQHPEFGWFLYVPDEPPQVNVQEWPFSPAFWMLLATLRARGINYVRLDRDAFASDEFPRVWDDEEVVDEDNRRYAGAAAVQLVDAFAHTNGLDETDYQPAIDAIEAALKASPAHLDALIGTNIVPTGLIEMFEEEEGDANGG